MDGRTFYHKIDDHEELEWLAAKEGATPGADYVIIGNPGFYTKFAMALSSIREQSWSDLEAVLLLKRAPQIMKHMTRIVGYYSPIDNWNKSKLGELAARRRGVEFYAVPDAA